MIRRFILSEDYRWLAILLSLKDKVSWSSWWHLHQDSVAEITSSYSENLYVGACFDLDIHFELFLRLIHAGVDINTRDGDYLSTAFDYLCHLSGEGKEREPLYDFVKNHGGKISLTHRKRLDFPEKDYLFGTSTHLKSCIDLHKVNKKDEWGWAPLMHALVPSIRTTAHDKPLPIDSHVVSDYKLHSHEFLSDGHPVKWLTVNPENIRILLESGANPNIADDKGASPGLLAMNLGNENILNLLIEAGLDTHKLDRHGLSILDHSAHWLKIRPLKVIQTFGEIVFKYGSKRVFDYINSAEGTVDEELEREEQRLITSYSYTPEEIEKWSQVFPTMGAEAVKKKMTPEEPFESYYARMLEKYTAGIDMRYGDFWKKNGYSDCYPETLSPEYRE